MNKLVVRQSRRDGVIQLRVARTELPWVAVDTVFNPNGVAPHPRRSATPLGLLAHDRSSQGSSFLATLGFKPESRWDSVLGFFKFSCTKPKCRFPSSFVLRISALLLAAAVMNSIGSVRAETNLLVINQSAAPPTVGMEGQIDVALPIAGLITKPGDHRAPLVLRIAAAQPHGTLTRYDLRYAGRVPGPHDLRGYLFTAEGQPATNLPPVTVTVAGLLPSPHNGWLEEQAHRAPTLFSSYRALLIGAGVLWILAFFVIRRLGRTPRTESAPAMASRPPSFAEKIRPLVERAAAGQLTADEKATLERMLITHWQQRLKLSETNASELMAQLRQHPEAGALLRAMEDWLHRPPGRATVRVEEFLAPYKQMADSEPREVRV